LFVCLIFFFIFFRTFTFFKSFFACFSLSFILTRYDVSIFELIFIKNNLHHQTFKSSFQKWYDLVCSDLPFVRYLSLTSKQLLDKVKNIGRAGKDIGRGVSRWVLWHEVSRRHVTYSKTPLRNCNLSNNFLFLCMETRQGLIKK